MNVKRFLILMVTIATTGMMGACGQPEPTSHDIMTEEWNYLPTSHQESICTIYWNNEDLATTTFVDEFAPSVTPTEAGNFMLGVC